MAGRVRRGESWRFAELRSEIAVFVDAELAYLDRFELRPSDLSPTKRWAMDRYEYMATAIAFDPSVDEEHLESIRSDIASIDGAIASGPRRTVRPTHDWSCSRTGRIQFPQNPRQLPEGGVEAPGVPALVSRCQY